jgi:hypothetical protein
MMSNRRCPVLLAAGLLLLSLAAADARGQDRLDASFYTNDSSWSPQQRQTAAAFVSNQVQAMRSGEEGDIAEAKTRLITELTITGANPRFVRQLSDVVVEQLRPLTSSDQLLVRINAMIVAGNVQTPEAMELVLTGLADDNAGVRYLASKAMENLLAGDLLNDPQRERVMDRLQQLAAGEDEVFVVQPLFEALLRAGDLAQVIEALNQRVAWHAQNPTATLAPERATLQTAFSTLFTASAANRPAEQVRELARASARYLLMVARQLEENPDRVSEDRTRFEIVQVAASALEFAHNELRVPGNLPPAGRAAEQQDWARLVEAGETWIARLQEAPFNFSAEQVTVGD